MDTSLFRISNLKYKILVLPSTLDPAMHCVYTRPPSSDQKHDIPDNDYYNSPSVPELSLALDGSCPFNDDDAVIWLSLISPLSIPRAWEHGGASCPGKNMDNVYTCAEALY